MTPLRLGPTVLLGLSALALALSLVGCATLEAPRAQPRLLAHYMPWYEAPPQSQSYGWHWHMGYFDPEGGTLATHYPPLIGAYDSTDPRVIEYQLMTMKAAGIEGVIVDWYGVDDVLDYAPIHRASQALFEAVRRAGMTFVVCYEDQSVTQAEAVAPGVDGVARAAAAFAWMEAHWFRDPAYLKFDGRPVVLTFGPQRFTRTDDWNQIFKALGSRPWLVTLEGHLVADGSYNWPDMSRSKDGVLSWDSLVAQLEASAARPQGSHPVATAWPGFHDVYQEAGVRPSYGFLDDAEGGTLRLTLDAALARGAEVVQLATWNDYGEGTVLEPNLVRGYQPLEIVQRARQSFDPSFGFSAADLRLPWAVYQGQVDSPALAPAVAAWWRGDPQPLRNLVPLGVSDPVLGTKAPGVPAPAQGAPNPARATPGSPVTHLASGRPARSNNHIYDFTADQAFDGDLQTYWEGGPRAYPNDLEVDLGTDRAVDRIVVRLNPRRIWGARTQTIEVLAGQGTEARTVVPATEYRFDPATENAVSITVRASHRYWTLRFTANSEATAGQAAEVEFLVN